MLWLLKDVVNAIISSSAVLINGLISGIFKTLGQKTKKHTKVDEQSTSFKLIFFMEFSNMGLIALIQSLSIFHGLNAVLLDWTALTFKSYPGFTPEWYMDQGKKICLFIFLSSFLSNTQDINKFAQAIVVRFYDRKFKMHLKKDPEDEDDDEPNTRQKIQSDLETLYTGKEFQGEKAFSRMMSTLFVVMLYSSGMPILYPVGFVFYLATYFANKLLIIKFYQKSRTLTRTIPIFSQRFLKVGLVLHMIGALFMLTNPDAFTTKQRDSPVIEKFDPVKQVKELDKKVTGREVSALTNSLLTRAEYFHQQLFLTFLIAFFFFYLVGKSTYNAIEALCSALSHCLKRLASGVESCCKSCKRSCTAKVRGTQAESTGESEQDLASDSGNEALDEDLSSDYSDSSEEDSMDNEGQHLVQGDQEEGQNKQEKEKRANEKRLKRQKILEFKEKKRKRILKARRERPDYSENILKEMNTENLSNFYERSKKELADFRDIFNLEPNHEIGDELLDPKIDPKSPDPKDKEKEKEKEAMRTVFLEICFMSRITAEQVQRYQKFLMKRVKDIEAVVHAHFELIKDTLIQQKKEQFDRDRKKKKKEGKEGTLDEQLQQKINEKTVLDDLMKRFNNEKVYTAEAKMIELVQHQEDLIKADKARKENRQGVQEVCRMMGSLAQSYFIFDSQQYKVARKIYYGVDDQDGEDVASRGALRLRNGAGADQQDDEGSDAESEADSEESVEDDARSKRSRRSKRSGSRSAQSKGRSSSGKGSAQRRLK